MIYLASQSPRRKQLMELTGLEFTVRPTNADESGTENMSPKETVEYLSRIKAFPLFGSVCENDIIIGSDTVVELGNEILGKPKDREDAVKMLKMLSGNTHSVFTGVTILKKENGKEKIHTFSCETKVEFFELTEDEIKTYVKTGEADDKAGAYGIQERGSLFVKAIHGDFFNVVGLPIAMLYKELKKLNGIG